MHSPILAAAVGTEELAPGADGAMHRGAFINVGRRDVKASLRGKAESAAICLECSEFLSNKSSPGNFDKDRK